MWRDLLWTMRARHYINWVHQIQLWKWPSLLSEHKKVPHPKWTPCSLVCSALIHLFSHSSFVKICLMHIVFKTVRNRKLKFWENVHPQQHVTCHMSSVPCHNSGMKANTLHLTRTTILHRRTNWAIYLTFLDSFTKLLLDSYSNWKENLVLKQIFFSFVFLSKGQIETSIVFGMMQLDN